MRNFFLSLLAFSCSFPLSLSTQAQAGATAKRSLVTGKQEPSTNKQAVPNLHLQVYHNAVALGDYGTAIQSLHYLLASGSGSAQYLDTLAIAYLNSGAYAQAYTLSDNILKMNGANLNAWEVKAVSAVQLQEPVIAVDAYSYLFDKTQKITYGFQKLQLEYSIRRVAETVVTADKLLQLLPAGDSSIVTVLLQDKKSTQKILLKTGILHMKAMALLDLKEKEKAIVVWKEALQLNPEYEDAKINLAQAQKGS